MRSGRPLALVVALGVAFPLATAHADDGKAALALLPADTTMVMAVNVDRLKTSAYYADLLALAKQSGDATKGLALLRDQLGFDLEKDLSGLVLAGPLDGSSSDRFVLVVSGKLDAARLADYADKNGSPKQSHAGTTYWEVDGGRAIAMIGKRFVMAKVADLEAVIDRSKKQGKGLSARLKKLGAKVDRKQDLWLIADLGAVAQASSQGIASLSLSVDLKSGLGLKARLGHTDTAAADKVYDLFVQGLAALKGKGVTPLGLGPVVDKIAVSHAKENLDVSLVLDDAELRGLAPVLGLMKTSLGSLGSSTPTPAPPIQPVQPVQPIPSSHHR